MASSRASRLTAAEKLWYVIGCIPAGGMYFAKVPVKKALSECGLAELTSAEQFWYVLQCIAFGAGYLAKVPVKKALTESAHEAASQLATASAGKPAVPAHRAATGNGAIHYLEQSHRARAQSAHQQQPWPALPAQRQPLHDPWEGTGSAS
ncbi:MAG TPA: hypothetical protein VGI64_06585 [Streptosporangiaceae bacterium]|jgi:hypothetical protein